eukprot:1307505-Heterocapsa_arctica.AAC.1
MATGMQGCVTSVLAWSFKRHRLKSQPYLFHKRQVWPHERKPGVTSASLESQASRPGFQHQVGNRTRLA